MVECSSRRHLLVSMAALGVAACAGTRRSSAFWGTVTGAHPHETTATTRAYADALPYPSLLFWLDGQPRSLIVLGKVETGDRLTWYDADKNTITTYGPFIVATRGTDVELNVTEFGSGWSTDLRALVGKTLERRITVARAAGVRRADASATLRSSFHDAGVEEIKILDRKITVRRIDETVIANDRVRFTNRFWIDPATGFCRKSRQTALPTMQPANIEVLKAPVGTA